MPSCTELQTARTSQLQRESGTAKETFMSASDPEIGRSVEAAGLKTNFLEQGSGPPVVLLHGSGPGVTAYANRRLTIPALSRLAEEV